MVISIIMPVYNGVPFIRDAIQSVVSQTYDRFELIVVNDGSYDNTLSVIEGFKGELGDRLTVINQNNQGQVRAKNRGISMARGEFLAFLDSDDVWDRDKLRLQIDYLKTHSSTYLCYTEAVLIDEDSSVIGFRKASSEYRGMCFDRLIIRNNITASSVMIKKEVIKRVGAYDESLDTCENWDLWLRISQIYRIGFLPSPLTHYRIHKRHMSAKKQKMLEGRIKVLKKHRKSLNNSTYEKALFKAYLDFGKDFLWNADFKKAKKCLGLALKIKPFSLRCCKLYIKALIFETLLKNKTKV